MAFESPLFNLFGRSPIQPLKKHMHATLQCVLELPELVAAAYEGDWETAHSIRSRLRDHKEEADRLKNEIRSHMPNRLLMPVARSDLLELLIAQNNLAGAPKRISGLILGREMQFPETLRHDFDQFLKTSIDATHKAMEAIDELDNLLETGFSGQELKTVEQYIDRLEVLEEESDQQQIRLRWSLRQIENDLSPVDAIFMYEVITAIGRLSDIAQSVGHRLQILIAR